MIVGQVPVGGVVALLQSLTGTPELCDNWELCDGHTCVNVNSPFAGEAVPNLNGAGGESQRFLRGAATSGTTGGEDSHTLLEAEIPSHRHTVPAGPNSGTGPAQRATVGLGIQNYTGYTGGGLSHENRPPFYEVVWIIRIY